MLLMINEYKKMEKCFWTESKANIIIAGSYKLNKILLCLLTMIKNIWLKVDIVVYHVFISPFVEYIKIILSNIEDYFQEKGV